MTGVGTVAYASREASAQADVSGDFEATGDEATLSNAPAGLPVDASGEWRIETTGSLQQATVTLQVGYEGSVAELDEAVIFDGTSGTYDLAGDALSAHDDLSASDLMPAEAGGTRNTELRVRVVVSAVRDGSIIAEASVEDTVQVVVDKTGVEVAVGGTGSVQIDASDGG